MTQLNVDMLIMQSPWETRIVANSLFGDAHSL